MTRTLRFFFALLSVGLLAAGYFLAGLIWPAVGLILFGVLWIVGLVLRWDWVSPLALFAAFGAAALGLLLGLSTVILSSAGLCALLAWDLAEFSIRLRKISPDDDLAGLEQRHLARLAWGALAGAGLSAIALTLHLKPSFEWIVILVIFSVWGIGRVVDRLLNNGE